MGLPYGWLLSLNRGYYTFQVPKDDPVAYARWEFEGGEAIWDRFFRDKIDISGKDVLDLGCGPGGKTSFLATLKPNRIVGVDYLADLLTDAEHAKNILIPPGDRVRVEFVASDAADLPFPDNYFDVITCSDAMEHFNDPAAVVNESVRVLKSGGLFAIDFAQWGSYNGHHLGDFFKTWWVHLFWSAEDIESAVMEFARDEKNKFTDSDTHDKIDELVARRIDHFRTALNYLSIASFENFLRKSEGISVDYTKKTSAHPVLWPLTFIPGLRELAVARNVYILRKPET